MANKKYSTDREGGAAVAFLLGVVLASIGLFFLQAWVVMLIIGALHATIWTSLPAWGFWASCLVTLILRFVGGFFKSASRN